MNFKRRIDALEQILKKDKITLGSYRAFSCAILCYEPSEELELLEAVALLKKRLENVGRHVLLVSIADVFRELIVRDYKSLKEFWSLEKEHGLKTSYRELLSLFEEGLPLENLIKQKALECEPSARVCLLVRASFLYPYHRVTPLLDRLDLVGMKIPTVLFFPGSRVGTHGLRFMNQGEPDYNYRYHFIRATEET